MRASVRREVLARMLMVYYAILRDLTVEMISNVRRAPGELLPSFMPEYEREIFRVMELMKVKLASAKPSRYPSSPVFVRETATLSIGAPTRGTNSLFPEWICQITRTDSSPPLSKYAPLRVNVSAETA